MQAFEKQTGFLQPKRLGVSAATPRRKVFGPDGNGVTRGSEKPEGQPPALADADDGERLRPDFETRRTQVPTVSVDADDGKRLRPDFRTAAKAGIARATVRIFPSGNRTMLRYRAPGETIYARNGVCER